MCDYPGGEIYCIGLHHYRESAVSRVIGVILVISITVILAAVIASFVFGSAGNIQKTKVVAATVAQHGLDVTVTYQGGQDDPSLSYLKVAINQTFGPWYTSLPNGGKTLANGGSNPSGGVSTAVTDNKKPAVGAQYTIVDGGTAARDTVVVTGHFTDGSEQAIMDTIV